MALPKTSGKKKSTNKGAVKKNRGAALTKSVVSKFAPTKIVSRGFNQITSKIAKEVPEVALFSGVLGDFISDLAKGMKSENKKNVEEQQEANDKLTKIKKNTGKTTDTLMEVLKIVDNRLFKQLEGDSIRLAELRTMTGIAADANKISAEQLAALRKANELKEKEEKEKKFTKQKAGGKIKPKVSQPPSAPTKQKSALMTFLEGTFLARLLTGFGSIFEGLLVALGGSKLLSAGRKLIGAPADGSKIIGFNKNGMPIDEKKRFVKQTPRNMRLAEKAEALKAAGGEAKGASKAAGGFSKVGGAIKGVGKGLGLVGLAITIIEALIGGIREGIVSYKKGNDAAKVIADGITGAFVAVVKSIPSMLQAIFIELPKLLGGITIELIKNIPGLFMDFSKYMDENVTKPLSKKLVKVVRGVFKTVGDGIVDMWEYLKTAFMNGMKNMLNAVIDKTHTRRFLPDSVKTFLETPDPTPVGGSLSVSPKTARTAASIVTGQKNLNEFQVDSMLGGIGGAGGSVVAAPITTNVQNNNIFSGNIHTRNPDSPVFVRDKVNY